MKDEEEETKIRRRRKFKLSVQIEDKFEWRYLINKSSALISRVRKMEMEELEEEERRNRRGNVNVISEHTFKYETRSLRKLAMKLRKFMELMGILLTLACWQSEKVSCQMQNFLPQDGRLTRASDHLLLGQRQALDQLMRTSESYRQRPAERRASANQPASQAAPTSGAQQASSAADKLLVCYYTTRQAAPFWPKDAREYVIAADRSNEASLAPILQYEPFAQSNQQQLDANLNVKNQQQQLVFKSANVQQLKAQTGEKQEAIAQLLMANQQQQQQQQIAQTTIPQQTLIISDNASASKSKQTPAYSLIGDSEISAANSNNLIVGGTLPLTPIVSGNNGGNNFIISSSSNKDANNGNHPERNKPAKQSQAQQIVFSPSLSRAFIVGNANNANNNNNNELLDTKSQLFVPAGHGGQYGNNNQQLAAPVHKAKGLQLSPAADQVSPAHPFSQVSSTPPVPLSSASSSGSPTQQQIQQANGSPYRSALPQLQQPPAFNPAANQKQPPAASAASPANNLKLANQPTGSGGSAAVGSPANSLSSAFVASPLSTMFDVFGAASQYLMRFKPSSLMSPASFAFNTIPSNHLQQAGVQLQSQQAPKSANSSSLIPMPFSSSTLIANLQKSAQNSPAPPPSSNAIARFTQSGQRREDVCGRTIQTPQRRIIGGEGARYGEFPYQVHIKIAKHQCGGALVDKQSIVTAAHCVYHFITRAPVSKLQIVIGAYDIEDEQYQELPPQYFKVNKVKLHPNFRFSASHPDRYDIAILKLDKPVKYTDNVLPVCLPSRELKLESSVGTVTGFGKTDPSLSNRYGTRLLQKVDVPIIENNECERWHRTRGIDLKIFPEMMCAGYEDGLKDACVGDSGGPLVVKSPVGNNGSFRWTLAGITSAGFGCAQSRQPGIYHRVSHTVDWILENLDQ